VQGEARNANLAISTALAMGASGGGLDVDEELKRHLDQARGEAAAARKEHEAAEKASSKSKTQVAVLQRQLGERDAEVEALQRQVREAARSSAQQAEEPNAVARELMSVAKTTALEAAIAELRCVCVCVCVCVLCVRERGARALFACMRNMSNLWCCQQKKMGGSKRRCCSHVHCDARFFSLFSVDSLCESSSSPLLSVRV